ncbi:MAG: DUF1963 domain-containing protein [Micrococcales bacterium]|nr:DUF1963 domain-containing protein [Micrococcales bacterium]
MADVQIEKYLVQQTWLSNKFWQVSTNGSQQTVRYGRVGTDGREKVKGFDDADTCRRETEKLVASKMRKGYLEVADESDDERAELMFWDAIETSNKWKKVCDDYDTYWHLDNFIDVVEKKSKNAAAQFRRQFAWRLETLHTGPIADLFVIMNNEFSKDGDQVIFDDSFSNDGFLFFRCWLLLKGRELFDDVTADINAFASDKYTFDTTPGPDGSCGSWVDTAIGEILHKLDPDRQPRTRRGLARRLRLPRRSPHRQRPAAAVWSSSSAAMDPAPTPTANLQDTYPQLVTKIVSASHDTVELILAGPGPVPVWSSKIGGQAYLPPGATHPVATGDEPLRLLAQLNFGELAHLDGFPTNGLLQFFICTHDLLEPYECNDRCFRAVYHLEVIEDETFVSTVPVDPDGDFPVSFDEGISEYRITGQLCRRFVVRTKGHHIGGYPLSIQGDPRECNDDFAGHTTLLFQLDSDDATGIEILWGDMGVGNFFIQPDRLAALDFSNVLYNWECS